MGKERDGPLPSERRGKASEREGTQPSERRGKASERDGAPHSNRSGNVNERDAARLSNRRRKEIRSLTLGKYRDRLGEVLIEGVRAVESAVSAGIRLREIVVTPEAKQDSRISALLGRSGADVYVLPREELRALSAVETSQGILAVVAFEPADPGRLHGVRRVLLFDGLQDPGNAGTLIRTAAWFGVEAVVTGPGAVDVYNPKVVRAAMGGLWDVTHVRVESLSELISDLRDRNFRIYGADVEGTSMQDWRPTEPSLLVLGSEAHGISEAMRSLLDERIAVPGSPHRRATESLNVGVAAGILMYEWTKTARGA